MILWEEGKFQLDDPISKYIPEFKGPQVLKTYNDADGTWTGEPAKREITIRDLLTHTSGLGYGDIDGDPRFQKLYKKAGINIAFCSDPLTIGENVKRLAKMPLDVPIVAIGLVNIVNNLNQGLDIGGNPMGSQAAMVIGVGANPGALNMDEELRRLEWKVEAGAEYVVTQPVFDLNLLEQFRRRLEHTKLPLIAGVWPLTSYRNAEFMVNELRVPVPEEHMNRMRSADSAERARLEGIAIAQEMVQRAKPLVEGVQLSAPFGRYQMALEVAQAIGAR
jgi:homocysteine S-methyltransferase